MWYELLPGILNMSLTGSAVILVVLLARLLLRRAPKVFSYALWAIVLFRLLCPVSLPSDFSVFNLAKNTTQSSQAEYFQYNGKTEKPMLEFGTDNSAPAASTEQDTAAVNPEGSARHTPDVYLPIALTIWLFGVAAMLAYSVISYFLLRRRLVGTVCLRENLYLADGISSPFVMGLIRPKIYLPSTLSEKEQEYIILHEQHHIRRCDHVVKILSFAALCVHWFNPLVWLAFVLSGKDMEMSCDEAVIKKLGGDIRADYSASLLSLATGRRIISGTPLAFGEGDTGGRIRNVLNYKKPAFWVIIAAMVACVSVALCLVTNPRKTSIDFSDLTSNITQAELYTLWGEEKVYGTLTEEDSQTVSQLLSGVEQSAVIGDRTDALPVFMLKIETALSAGTLCKYENQTQLELRFTGDDSAARYKKCGMDFSTQTWWLESAELQAYFDSLLKKYRLTEDNQLSLNDVILLSQKGEYLTWADFDGYSYIDTGSGLYIRIYEIDDLYSLRIGGSSPSDSPMYVTLYTNTEPEGSIDIRTESVTDFIEKYADFSQVFPSGNLLCTYSYDGGDTMHTASVSLYDSGEFRFTFSPLSSYIGDGKYTMENNLLTLETLDGDFTYVFRLKDDALVFDGDASSEQTWYSGIADGAVLQLTQE